MNIGKVAEKTGITAKSIRYYESINLIPAAGRSQGGYRQYDDRDVQILRFIKRARGLGFSVAQVGELLSLYRDTDRAAGEVKAIVQSRIGEIDAKLAELNSMRRTLSDLAHRCHGGDRPDCPILEDLAASEAGSPPVTSLRQ